MPIDTLGFTGKTAGRLEVTEVDGSPDVLEVTKIVVSNGTLTDDGGGTVTITTGGGGGGTVTSVDVSGGTTGLTTSGGAITTSGTITIAGTLIVANGGTGATTLTDNSVLTGAGTSAIIAEGNLTFNGSTLTITGDLTVTGDIAIGSSPSDLIGFYGAPLVDQALAINPYAPGPMPPAYDPVAIDNELGSIATSIQEIIAVLSEGAGGVGLSA